MRYLIALMLIATPAYAASVEGNISAQVVQVVTMQPNGMVDTPEAMFIDCGMVNGSYICSF